MQADLTPLWLEYGSFGLLAMILVAAYLLLRSYLAGITQQLTETSQFTRSIATKAMDDMSRLVAENQKVMAQYAEAQAEATAAMREMRKSMNDARKTSAKEHDRLGEDHQQILGGLKGGLRRVSGD